MRGTMTFWDARKLLASAVVLALALTVAGCSGASTPSGGMSSTGNAPSTTATTAMTSQMPAVTQASDSRSMSLDTSSSAMGTTKSDDEKLNPNTQNCISCTADKKAPAVSGTVMMKNGMQMIDISIKDGTYTPNRFTAKKGMPIEVMFTVVGKPAGDCLANPTFKSLDKTVHITMGSKALKLGTLAAGTYQFGCAMGMNTGDIVVQ